MPVDISPLLPAFFWSGLLLLLAWLVAQFLAAVASFRAGQEAMGPPSAEEPPADAATPARERQRAP